MMSAAHTPLLPLTDILNREEAACDQLLATLHKERTAIRRLAIDDFQTINEQRQAILASLEVLEEERRRVMSRLADSWGVPEERLTLQTIVERLTSPATPGLDDRYATLAKKLRTVREEIAFNARLIEAIQSFVTQVLSAWTESRPSDGLYSFSGDRGRASAGVAFVRQRV